MRSRSSSSRSPAPPTPRADAGLSATAASQPRWDGRPSSALLHPAASTHPASVAQSARPAMTGTWDKDTAGAFVEGLFAKHHGEIYAYLLRMLRDADLASDLTQDAFVKAYKNYHSLEKSENARAWLYQIAHRV